MKREAPASHLDALHDGGGGGVRRQWEGNNFRRRLLVGAGGGARGRGRGAAAARLLHRVRLPAAAAGVPDWRARVSLRARLRHRVRVGCGCACVLNYVWAAGVRVRRGSVVLGCRPVSCDVRTCAIVPSRPTLAAGLSLAISASGPIDQSIPDHFRRSPSPGFVVTLVVVGCSSLPIDKLITQSTHA